MIVYEETRAEFEGAKPALDSTSPDALAKLGYVFNELSLITERARAKANDENVVSHSDVSFMNDAAQVLLGERFINAKPSGDLASAVESLGQDIESFPAELRHRVGKMFDHLGNATVVTAQLKVRGTFTPDDAGSIFDCAAMMLDYYPYDGSIAAPERGNRTIESPAMLAARLERYVSNGMDRKLLKSFARDFCACAADAQRPFTRATGKAYQVVFEHFGLKEGAMEIKKALGLSA